MEFSQKMCTSTLGILIFDVLRSGWAGFSITFYVIRDSEFEGLNFTSHFLAQFSISIYPTRLVAGKTGLCTLSDRLVSSA